MAEVIREAIRAQLLDLRVGMPARVEKYNKDQQKVDVQPLLRRRYKKGTTVNLPVITGVPVQWHSANDGASYLVLPLKKNDTGWLSFSDRSLDSWLAGKGTITTPDSPRHHDLSDAVFQPGLRTFPNPLTIANGNNAYLKNGNITLELFPDGKIKIEGSAEEMLDTISTFMEEVIDGKINTGIGPQGWLPANKTAIQDAKDAFDTLKV